MTRQERYAVSLMTDGRLKGAIEDRRSEHVQERFVGKQSVHTRHGVTQTGRRTVHRASPNSPAENEGDRGCETGG